MTPEEDKLNNIKPLIEKLYSFTHNENKNQESNKNWDLNKDRDLNKAINHIHMIMKLSEDLKKELEK